MCLNTKEAHIIINRHEKRLVHEVINREYVMLYHALNDKVYARILWGCYEGRFAVMDALKRFPGGWGLAGGDGVPSGVGERVKVEEGERESLETHLPRGLLKNPVLEVRLQCFFSVRFLLISHSHAFFSLFFLFFFFRLLRVIDCSERIYVIKTLSGRIRRR